MSADILERLADHANRGDRSGHRQTLADAGDEYAAWVLSSIDNLEAAGTAPNNCTNDVSDQHAAMLAAVQTTLSSLTMIDLAGLQQAVLPILAAWAAPDSATRSDVPILLAPGDDGAVDGFGVPDGAGNHRRETRRHDHRAIGLRGTPFPARRKHRRPQPPSIKPAFQIH